MGGPPWCLVCGVIILTMEYARGASPKGRMALARRNPVIERGGAAFPEGKTAPARKNIGCPWVPDIDIARVIHDCGGMRIILDVASCSYIVILYHENAMNILTLLKKEWGIVVLMLLMLRSNGRRVKNMDELDSWNLGERIKFQGKRA